MKAVYLALEPLWALLFAVRCVVCDARQRRALCDGCAAQVNVACGRACTRCDHPLGSPGSACPDGTRLGHPAFERVLAAGVYRGALKAAVLALKYRDGWRVADALAARLADRVQAAEIEVDGVVAVPIDSARQAARGYSQSLLLASRLAVRLGVPNLRRVLVRCVDGVVQSTADLAQRHAQVEHIFEARGALEGTRLLLVDDVMTTAATMHAAAGALRARGSRVWGAVVARQTMRNGGRA